MTDWGLDKRPVTTDDGLGLLPGAGPYSGGFGGVLVDAPPSDGTLRLLAG